MAQDNNQGMFGFTPSQGVVEAPVVSVNQRSPLAGVAESLQNLLVTRGQVQAKIVEGADEDRYWQAKNKELAFRKEYQDIALNTSDVQTQAEALQRYNMQTATLSDEFQLGEKHRAMVDRSVSDFVFGQHTTLAGKIDTIETNRRMNHASGLLPNLVGEKPDLISENMSMMRDSIAKTGKMELPEINQVLSGGYLNSVLLTFDKNNTSREQINSIREETKNVLEKFDPAYITSNDYLSFQNTLNMAEEKIKTDMRTEIKAMQSDVGVRVSDFKKKLDANPDLFSKEEQSNMLNSKKVSQVTATVDLAVQDSMTNNNNERLLELNRTNPREVANRMKRVIGTDLGLWKKYNDLGISVGKVTEIDSVLSTINTPGGLQTPQDLQQWKVQYDKAVEVGYPIDRRLHVDSIVMNQLYKNNPELALSDYKNLKTNPKPVTDRDVEKFWRNKILNAELISTRWDIDAKSGGVVSDAVKPLVKALMQMGLDQGDIVNDIDDYIDNNFMKVDSVGLTLDNVIIPKTNSFNNVNQYDAVLEAYGADAVVPLDVLKPEGSWKLLRGEERPEVISYEDLLYSAKGFGKPKKDLPKPTRNKPLSDEDKKLKKTEVAPMVSAIGTELGYDSNTITSALAVGSIESGLGTHPNTYDNSRKHRGMFQIGKDVLADINRSNGTNFTMNDVTDDYTATKIYMKYLYPMYKNAYNKVVPANLRKRDQDITPLDTYLIHQQGTTGFKTIMSNLNTPISEFKFKHSGIYENMVGNYYGKKDMVYVKDFINDWTRLKDKHFQEVLPLLKQGV